MYERRLFEVLSADIMYKRSSFVGFANAYYFVFSHLNKLDRQLNDQRLPESWMFYNLLLILLMNFEFKKN